MPKFILEKRFSSQTMCLLTNGPTTISDVKTVLAESRFRIVKEVAVKEDLCSGGPSVVVPFRPEVNGYVSADVVNQTWPDMMGDPASDQATLQAWSMGFFGPFAFPLGLKRAQQHAWAWPEAESAIRSHGGFIRLRLSYAFGLPDAGPYLPDDYNPLNEMNFLSELVRTLFALSSVICYFNPNGEVLRDKSSFDKGWNFSTKAKQPALSLWTNTRRFHLNTDENFLIMDTVGNRQLDVTDVEAVFPKADYRPGKIHEYLHNISHYLVESHPEINSGETFNAPDENRPDWVVRLSEKGLVHHPPRPVLRLYPSANQIEIEAAIAAQERFDERPLRQS